MSYPTGLGNGSPPRISSPWPSVQKAPPSPGVTSGIAQSPQAHVCSSSTQVQVPQATRGRRKSASTMFIPACHRGQGIPIQGSRPRAASAARASPVELIPLGKRKFDDGHHSPTGATSTFSQRDTKRVHSSPKSPETTKSTGSHSSSCSPGSPKSTKRRTGQTRPQSLNLTTRNGFLAAPHPMGGASSAGPSTAPLQPGYSISRDDVPSSAPPPTTTFPSASGQRHDPQSFQQQQLLPIPSPRPVTPQANGLRVPSPSPLTPTSSRSIPGSRSPSPAIIAADLDFLSPRSPQPQVSLERQLGDSEELFSDSATLYDSETTAGTSDVASRSVSPCPPPRLDKQPRQFDPSLPKEASPSHQLGVTEVKTSTIRAPASASRPAKRLKRDQQAALPDAAPSLSPNKHTTECQVNLHMGTSASGDATPLTSDAPTPSEKSSPRQTCGEPQAASTRTSSKRKNQTYKTLKEAYLDEHGPEELKAIYEFFHTAPPVLEPADDHTSSPNTKEPQEYDRHLDPSLVLRRVILCPKIENDLISLAEATVLQCWEEGAIPTIEEGDQFPDCDTLDGYKDDRLLYMKEEKSIVKYYSETTSVFTTAIAATLYFRQPVWGPGLLHWQDNTTGQAQEAIADGYLRAKTEVPKNVELRALPDLGEALIFARKNLLIWEFKNLLAGREQVMAAIVEWGNVSQFHWTYCEHGGHRSAECRVKHPPKNAQCSDGDFTNYKPPVGPSATDEDANAIWPLSLNPTGPQSKWTWKGPPRALVGKVPKRGERKIPLATTDSDRRHAAWILQQVYAQLLKNDATLAVISSGNFEIHCRRDRAENTLSISKLIYVPGHPSYGQLQTGLYLAALHDAKSRFSQPSNPTQEPPDTDSNEAQLEMLKCAFRRRELFVVFQAKARRESTPDMKIIQEEVPYLRHVEMEAHPDTSDLIRVQVASRISNSVSVGNLVIHGQRLGHPQDDGLHLGRVNHRTFEGLPQFNKRVYIKVADEPESLQKLLAEYAAYTELAKYPSTRGLVPKVVGLFKHVSALHNHFIMLLEDIGTDMDCYISERSLPLLNTLRTAFVEGLGAIHRAGVLHGAIHRPHHLLVKRVVKARKQGERDQIDVAFISFTEPVQEASGEDEELSILKALFPHGNHAATSPFLPRGRSPRHIPEIEYPKLEAYDYTLHADGWVKNHDS